MVRNRLRSYDATIVAVQRGKRNFAFIDSQNINLGVQELSWRIDWRRLRVYLEEKYGVGTAYIFVGFMAE